MEEFPTYPPHAGACYNITSQLVPLLDMFMDGMADTSYSLPNKVSQADLSYRPLGPNPGPGNVNAANPQGSAWPTLIIEV